MSPDLEARLRSARRPVSPPSPSVTTKAEAALLDRFARDEPRKRRLPAWLPMRRLVAGTLGAAALAGGIGLLVAHPWLENGTTVRISLGKDPKAPKRTVTPADNQPAIPIEAGEVPPVIKAQRAQVVPGTLRRRVVIQRPEGRYRLWTWVSRATGLEQLSITGPGYLNSYPFGSCDPLDSDGVPLVQCLAGVGTHNAAIGGRALPGVETVGIVARGIAGEGLVSHGYWAAVLDGNPEDAFQIHGYDHAGSEVVRLPGANATTHAVIEPSAPLPPASAGPTVPDLSGVETGSAIQQLKDLGFTVRRESLTDIESVVYMLRPRSGLGLRRAKAGEVVRQFPSKGTAMRRGRTVVVSTLAGEPPRSVEARTMEQNDPQVSDGFRSTFSSGGGFAPIGKVTRHLIVDFPAGRTEAWTMRRRDPAGHRGLYVTVTFGPGIGGSTTAGGGPEPESLDGPGAFPLQLAMSSSGSTGFQSLTGRAGSSVDKVSALYADGEGEVATGGGFWFLVPEPGRGAPLALIARDREGRELGRLAGARFQQVVSGRRQSLGRDPLGSIPKLVVPPRGEGVVVPSVARWSFRAPNVSVAEAKRLITAVGLVPKVRSTDASALSAPDVVVGQDPDGGSSMPAGGTVLLDVTAPAVQAPASLLVGVRRAANISSTTDQPVDGLRIGIVDFSTRPTSGWIMNRVQDRTPKGAVFSGARYVISADAPAESVVLWKPGKEQQAATIARRLGITKGATTEGLPRDLLATPEDSNADPAKPTYDVLVVLGTAPLKKPTGQGAVAP